MKNSYRTADCCASCNHSVDEPVQDGETEYYCNLDKTINVDYLGYGFPLPQGVSREKARNWCSTHRVVGYGVCNDFKNRIDK